MDNARMDYIEKPLINGAIMTMNDFNELCQRYTIAPDIALENDNIVQCLLDTRNTKDDNAKRGYTNCLIRFLETEF